MSILITGATGLIGTAMLDRLRDKSRMIICQSRNYYSDEPGVKWIKHDLVSDSWECLSPYEIDVVYYFAAQTSSYMARSAPIVDLMANVLGFLNLLEYFRGRGSRPFVVLAGTVTEVGVTSFIPLNEMLADHPVTFYDISKYTAEMYLKQYIREDLANGCVLRLSNVYGAGRPGQQSDRGILDKVFGRATSGSKITIYGDGNYLRDYIFIDDVISAFVAAADHRYKTNGEVFCIGSGKGILLKDAFHIVANLARADSGVDLHFEHVDPPADLSKIEQRNVVVDSTKFMNATNWSPKYDFDKGAAIAYGRGCKDGI